MMRNIKLSLLAGLGLSLSACVTINTPMGTGSNTNVIATDYPIETAMLNIYTKARSNTLSAMVDTQKVSTTITVMPKGAMLFNGMTVQGSEISTVSKLSDQTTNQSIATNYFTVNPLVFRGFTDNTGRYSVANQTSSIPKSARVGESSQFITETVYADKTMSRKIGTYQQTWSLTQESNNSAWLCVETSKNLLLNNDPNSPSTECYKINAQGAILASKVTIVQPTGQGNKAIEFMSQ